MRKIHWIRIVFLILFCMLISLPWPIYKTLGSFSPDHQNDPEQELPIFTSVNPLANPIITYLTGVKLNPVEKFICIKNKNVILFDGVKKSNNEILDKEAGAMAIQISYPDGKKEEIYSETGTTTCKILDPDYEYATTTNKATIRNVLAPIETPFLIHGKDGLTIKAVVASTSSIDYLDSKVFERIVFNMDTLEAYLKNVILTFSALIILIPNFVQILPYFYKKNDED